ncbi:MAG TPA: hypothetical protein VHC22_27385 [Pirellulales bacterium]|nr:hypothetical protein [Pirellulales bacterium]
MFKEIVSKKLVVMAIVAVGMAGEAQAAGVTPVAWRGGYSYRRMSAPAASTRNYSGRTYSGNRSSGGRTSALDYPAYTQPDVSRRHQWNKYPNQPYYLRGERKSLLILP